MTDTSEKTRADVNGVKRIYVSPHSDDVALSCGGQILTNPARSEDTLVLTMFTSERRVSHGEAGAMESTLFDAISSERTAEDRLAWTWAGVRQVDVGLPEALLRKRFPFKLGARGPEGDIIDAVAEVMDRHAESNPDAIFYLPAGFGNHVDHLACTEAGFRLLSEGRLGRIILYEDIPYCWLKFIRDCHYRQLLERFAIDRPSCDRAFRRGGIGLRQYLRSELVPFPRGRKLFPLVFASAALNNALRRINPRLPRFRAMLSPIALGPDELAQKTDLISRYKSQIPMLFGKSPHQLLDDLHESFAIEMTIDITGVSVD